MDERTAIILNNLILFGIPVLSFTAYKITGLIVRRRNAPDPEEAARAALRAAAAVTEQGENR